MIINKTVRAKAEVTVLVNGKQKAKFSNMLLNTFFSSLNSTIRYLHVGTGTTAPQATDTALTNPLAKQQLEGSVPETINFNSGTNVVTTSYRQTYVFPIGAVVGVIGELGVGISTSTTSLKTKALIKDELDNPITIPLTASDQLIVYYDFIYELDCSPVTTNVSINGVPTDITVTFCRSTDAALFNMANSNDPRYAYAAANCVVTSSSFVPDLVLPASPELNASGTLNDTNILKANTLASFDGSGAASGYSENTYSKVFSGVDNLPTEEPIDIIAFTTGNVNTSGYTPAWWNYVMQFSPAIAKTASFALTIELIVRLSR